MVAYPFFPLNSEAPQWMGAGMLVIVISKTRGWGGLISWMATLRHKEGAHFFLGVCVLSVSLSPLQPWPLGLNLKLLHRLGPV